MESNRMFEYRLTQPREELERKAKKSHRRKCRLWTQEEIDLIHYTARNFTCTFKPARIAS